MEHFDPVAADKRIARLHGEEHSAGFHYDRDVNVKMRFIYKVGNGEMRAREYGVETLRIEAFL